MVTIPGFLLRRLYVKGSLKRTGDGFQFELKNTLGSGYAKEMRPLSVDGKEAPLAQCFFTLDGQETCFAEVSEQKPFTLKMNKCILIQARQFPIEAGARKIGMGFVVPGLGKLGFDFTDMTG